MPAERWRTIMTPIGVMRIWCSQHRLTGVVIQSGKERATPLGEAAVKPADPLLERAAVELEEYFAGRRRSFDLTLDLSGCSAFARRVLEELAKVPYGETVTYGELAARAGAPGAARAVGRAMALNPLPIIIPCHRVVAANGGLGGYSGGRGVPTKEWLLAFERRNRSRNRADSREKTA